MRSQFSGFSRGERSKSGPWFGLTPIQRETLLLAIERGYYEIPRQCTTLKLAEELGVSDQAITERLRRAIVTLVSNTVQFSTTRRRRSVGGSERS
nr:helix-turn-helix domain-containing protein [Halalkalicoccus paucihalophilus]